MPTPSVAAHNARLDRMRLWLREQVQGAITEVQKEGISVEEAAQITVAIAADNLRAMHGEKLCLALADHVIARMYQPMAGAE